MTDLILQPPTPNLVSGKENENLYRFMLEIYNRTGGYNNAIPDFKGLKVGVRELNTLYGINTDDTVQGQLAKRELLITPGAITQYFRGDKTWQALNTAAVIESINLYYTDARARGALSVNAPITYNPLTGLIGITLSSGAADGYLSSANWTTFNNAATSVSAATDLNTASTIVKRDASGNAYLNLKNGAGNVVFDSTNATLTLVPRGAAPGTPAEGMMYVDNTAGNHLYIYLNAAWNLIV